MDENKLNDLAAERVKGLKTEADITSPMRLKNTSLNGKTGRWMRYILSLILSVSS